MKIIAIRIEPAILKKLQEIGKKEDRSVSYLIRKAVQEFVKSHGRAQ